MGKVSTFFFVGQCKLSDCYWSMNIGRRAWRYPGGPSSVTTSPFGGSWLSALHDIGPPPLLPPRALLGVVVLRPCPCPRYRIKTQVSCTVFTKQVQAGVYGRNEAVLARFLDSRVRSSSRVMHADVLCGFSQICMITYCKSSVFPGWLVCLCVLNIGWVEVCCLLEQDG